MVRRIGTGWASVSLLKNIDADRYNVIVVSPRNYFLFTPLLPSCTTGLIEHRSIMEPIRQILKHKRTNITFYEAHAKSIDPESKVVRINSSSETINSETDIEVPYDMLVVGVGAENATFGVQGVHEHSCFLKEVSDAQAIRKKIMDCVERASFKGQSESEMQRLLHMVIVGGGPTGVEFAGELHDFVEDDLRRLYPEIANQVKVTLIEALPNVLPSFSKQLIEFTETTFKEGNIDILAKTAVKKVDKTVLQATTTHPNGEKSDVDIPYGLLVWATGNTMRPLVRDLLSQIDTQKGSRRGIAVDEYLAVRGAPDIWAVGDCAASNYAPTAQVAGQQGVYLARLFDNKAKVQDLQVLLQEQKRDSGDTSSETESDSSPLSEEIMLAQRQLDRAQNFKPFHYTHQGSLAYIGREMAVADIAWRDGNIASGGRLTFLFWRSAYLSMCFSSKSTCPLQSASNGNMTDFNPARNRILVILDWLKSKTFGRDVSRE